MRQPAAKIVMVIVGLLMIAIIYPTAMILVHRTENEYADAMMGSIYFTLGIFLLLGARNPAANRSLVLFAGWSSLAHASVMAVMSASGAAERTHLLFGVALFAVIGAVLLIFSPAKGGWSAAASAAN